MAAPQTAPTAEFQDAGKPVARASYLVDSNGNPIGSSNPFAVSATLNEPAPTSDGMPAANLTEIAIGLYNSSGSVIDRLRDAGSLGDNYTIGLIGAAQFLFNGSSFDRFRTPQKFISIQNVAVTAGTPVTIWTPGGGKKFHLMGFAVSLSVAGYILFEDSAAEFLRTPAMAAGVGIVNPGNFGNGYTSTNANNALKIDVSASGNVNGFCFGTEEF